MVGQNHNNKKKGVRRVITSTTTQRQRVNLLTQSQSQSAAAAQANNNNDLNEEDDVSLFSAVHPAPIPTILLEAISSGIPGLPQSILKALENHKVTTDEFRKQVLALKASQLSRTPNPAKKREEELKELDNIIEIWFNNSKPEIQKPSNSKNGNKSTLPPIPADGKGNGKGFLGLGSTPSSSPCKGKNGVKTQARMSTSTNGNGNTNTRGAKRRKLEQVGQEGDESSSEPGCELKPFISTKLELSIYEDVLLGLQCPLPEEHQFALSICLLLSSKILPDLENTFDCSLQLADCPELLDLLLAHTGVFNHSGQRELFDDFSKTTGIQYSDFWTQLLKQKLADQPAIRELLYDDCTESDPRRREPEAEEDSDFSYDYFAPDPTTTAMYSTGQYSDSSGTTASGGTQTIDHYFKISCIFKNACKSDANAYLMANHAGMIRYLIFALNSSSTQLSQTAQLILAELSRFMFLFQWTARNTLIRNSLVHFVESGLSSENRFLIISSMNVIIGWASQCCNDEILDDLFGIPIWRRLYELLLVQDLQLIVSALNCICELTHRSCKISKGFAMLNGFGKTMESLLTFTVKTMRKQAFIGVKVCEIRTSTHSRNQLTSQDPAGTVQIHPKNGLPPSSRSPPPPPMPGWISWMPGPDCHLGTKWLLTTPTHQNGIIQQASMTTLTSLSQCSGSGPSNPKKLIFSTPWQEHITGPRIIDEVQAKTFLAEKHNELTRKFECPIDSTIRWTAALILRNLCRNSDHFVSRLLPADKLFNSTLLSSSSASTILGQIWHEVATQDQSGKGRYHLSDRVNF